MTNSNCPLERGKLRIVWGPQSGWAKRMAMMRASKTAESWCGQGAGFELSLRARIDWREDKEG
jgi:hypothetical protein